MSAAMPERFGESPVMDRTGWWLAGRASRRASPLAGTLAAADHHFAVCIRDVVGDSVICQRLLEVGFTPGQSVTVLAAAPLKGPLAVTLRGTIMALRREEAACILL
jgi:ferrous iron transport protein A